MNKILKCYDLCCGVGGLSLGFESSGAQVLGGIDKDHYAIKTASSNFKSGTWEIYDLKKFSEFLEKCKKHPAHECTVLLAGLPCQGFSVAGKGDPKDERNHLYKYMLQVVSLVRPHFIVFENVNGILSTKNNRILKRIERDLSASGYSVTWRVLNAFDFGVPQIRRRLFLIASDIVDANMVFAHLRTLNGKKNVKDAFMDLSTFSEQLEINHIFMKHGKRVQNKLVHLKPNGPLSYRRLIMEKPAFTIIAGHRALPVHPVANRAITVREAARLQGFPDTFLFYGKRSNQINHVANAVPPPVAAAIGRAISASIKAIESNKPALTKKLEKVITRKSIDKIRFISRQHFKMMGRNFPWRQEHDPYRILVTEILLQRTDSVKVNQIWAKAMQKCPSSRSASKIQAEDLQPIFNRIGIFSRARTIVELSKAIIRTYNGRIPKEHDSLMRLPGVGLYTASAVRIFAFGAVDFPVDTNTFRFFSRYFGLRLTGKKSEARQIRDFMIAHLNKRNIREFSYGFLDFTSEICCPKVPKCNECRLKNSCTYYSKLVLQNHVEEEDRKSRTKK